MPVHEHQLSSGRHGDATADVIEDFQQRVGRQPDRARGPGVLVGLRVRERREQPHVPVESGSLNSSAGDSFCDQEIRVEREVRAVLFDGAQWLDQDRPRGQELIELRCSELVEASTRRQTMVGRCGR